MKKLMLMKLLPGKSNTDKSRYRFMSRVVDMYRKFLLEDVLGINYNSQVTPWLNINPMVRYIVNPGGNDTSKNATIFGLRIL